MKGNRYFKLDVIDNHRIIYKPDKRTCFYIELPKLRKCELEKLRRLQLLAESKTIPLTFSLSKTDVCITYDETVFRDYNYQPMENRILSIDSNPNNTGWSVLEFDHTGEFRVLDSGIINISVINQMNKGRKTNSSDPLKLKETRKRTYEIYELSKFLTEKAKHYRCCKFVVEDLQFQPGDRGKGKNFNRLVNNKWNRTKWFGNLLKRCNIIGIEFVLVNPAYSSVIGNALHGISYPDPICAAVEIGRRGLFKFQKGMFYPVITKREELFGHLRKNGQTELDFSNCDDWKDVATQIKTLKTSYRSSVSLFNNLTVCSFRFICHDRGIICNYAGCRTFC
jgi:IS605 OrfB family transposase